MNIFEIKEGVLKSDPKYIQMIQKMDEEAMSFSANFHDSPEYLSEWGHNYFCPTDGERLIFDLNKPKEHECKFCHKVYQTDTLNNVWIYFYRNEAILTLMKLSVLYKTSKEQKYLDAYKKILSFYAENYTKFDLHVKGEIMDDLTYDVGGAGRLMPQGLNEAIVMIRIVTSMEILKGDLDEAFVADVNEKLFLNAVAILAPQLIRIHNIPCWLNAAVGVIGLYTQNQELIDLVFKGEFGINEQLKQGVTGDKFWYEGSIHYNFFLLEGVVNLLAFSKIYEQEFVSEDIVKEMLIQAYHYAFENNILPNPNDGWPNVTLKSYEYIYCLAAKVFGEESEIYNIYKHILVNEQERVEFPLSKPYYFNNEISFERLVCLPDINIEEREPITRGSVCFKNSYFTMLRNKRFDVFMKYGHRGPSHAHPDKMNIEIMVDQKTLSRDLSNSGYTSVLCNEWHRKTISHNTVVVDGLDQVSMDGGEVLKYDEHSCHTLVKNVYEGVDYRRDIDLEEEEIKDEFVVSSKEEHTYDWIFHSEAELVTNLSLEDASLGYETNGYEYLHEVKKIVANESTLQLQWNLQGIALASTIDIANKEVYLAKTYDNPTSKYRTAIILRDQATETKFNVNWEIL